VSRKKKKEKDELRTSREMAPVLRAAHAEPVKNIIQMLLAFGLKTWPQ
jgi:hypothetical protein